MTIFFNCSFVCQLFSVRSSKMDIEKRTDCNTDCEKPSCDDVKVEDILKSLGGFSTYQRWLAFALIFPQFPTAMIVLSPVFTGSSKVPIYCQKESYFDVNDHCNRNCTIDTHDAVYSSIVQEWGLTCSSAWIVDLITSFQMAGMMTGAFLSSLLSDHFGRKKCFIFQTICMGVLGMLPAAAFNPWSYAIARYLAGFGVGACFVIYLSHLMEFLTPSWRTICGTISLWPIGEMLLGLVAYIIVGWRWLTVVVAAPVLCLLFFHRTVLESPRWLLVRKKTTEAHQVFCTIAKWNGRPDPDIKLIEKLQFNVLKEESTSVRGIQAVKMILQHSKLRIHMAILTLANTTCAVVYYGVSFNAKNLSGNPYLNMFYMGIFDLVASPAAILFNNRIGRKKTFTLYMGIGTAFIISLLIVDGITGLQKASSTLVTVLSLCARFGIVASWSALTCLILESSPTNLRSSCLGFTAFAGYLGTVVAPQIFLLSTYAESLPYVVLCVLTVTSSVSSWFLRETLKQPLEDTVEKE